MNKRAIDALGFWIGYHAAENNHHWVESFNQSIPVFVTEKQCLWLRENGYIEPIGYWELRKKEAAYVNKQWVISYGEKLYVDWQLLQEDYHEIYQVATETYKGYTR